MDIQSSSREEGFYVVGGTLHRHAPSYLERLADVQLFENLRAGKFCYVLTPRQMGKSSLMIRTAARLREAGVEVAVLDLTASGQNLTVEQWYGGLLSQIGQQLDLEDELLDFWKERSMLSPLQRWTMAIHDIVLPRYISSLIIFIDEIDAIRNLDFQTDEFFAGIREFYNRRTQDESLDRLTFCLLGVASPSDLIKDIRTTPFNIGQRIELHDFTAAEAAPLATGLNREPELSSRLMKRILFWTNGHPYLTQRLCRTIAGDETVRNEQNVDQVCEELFLSSRARERDDNLLFVRESLLRSEADLTDLLGLYNRVLSNVSTRPVYDDETNPLFSVLQLSGITRVENGVMVVRNRIYARAFDPDWINSNLPEADLRRQRKAFRRGVIRGAVVSLGIIAVIACLAVYAFIQRNNAIEQQQINKKLLYAAQMNLLAGDWEKANIKRMEEIIKKYHPGASPDVQPGFEWRFYNNLLSLHRWSVNLPDLALTVAFSPDGKYFAASGKDKNIYLWSDRDKKSIRILSGHTDQVWKITFSPDGKTLASAGWDKTVRLWDVNTGHELKTLSGHDGNVCGLDFSPDGKRIVSGSWDRTVKIRDIASGRTIMTLTGNENWVWYTKYSHDGRIVASAGEDGKLRLWNASDGRLLKTLTAGQTSIYCLDFSSDDTLIAAGTNLGTVKLWDVQTGFEKRTLTGHKFSVYAVVFTPHGKQIASAGIDRIIRFWDLESGHLLNQIKGHANWIRDLTFSPDGHRIATAGDDKTVKQWDFPIVENPQKLPLSGAMAETIDISNDNKIVATGDSSTLILWEAASGKKIRDIQTASLIYCARISPDNRLIAMGHRNHSISLWNAADGGFKGILLGHLEPVSMIAFSTNGKLLASGGRDHKVRLWDLTAMKEIAVFDRHTRNVNAAAFSPDDRFLATGSDDFKVKIWDLDRKIEVSSLDRHVNEVWALAFTPDGQFLATGGDDHLVKIWDWKNRRELQTLSGHAAGVRALAFSPDGNRLVTGSDDYSIKIWEMPGGTELTTLTGHTAPVTSVAFSRDGTIIASEGRDHNALLWKAPKSN